ncbi:MAG TPA: hypothetical protein VFG91_00390 [Woeseiaceae bacterium]|nr:hypothetical protein [Woeseiaceae bacterium]
MANRLMFVPALCLVLVLGACATPPESPTRTARTVVSIPLDIGRLKITRSYDYPDPRLGVVYAYSGNFALTPDVYIYPNPFLAGPPSDEARMRSLEPEVLRFKNEIERAVQRGHYDSAEFHGTTDIRHAWRYGTVRGKRVTLTIVKDGHSALSHAYLFPVADRFVKIRISHYEYFGLADNMDWFAGELVDGTRVAFYDADGAPLVEVDDGLTMQDLLSRMDDAQVVAARKASLERAIVETLGGAVYYGEFDRKEPVLGPIESGAAQAETGPAGAGAPL